MSLANVRWHATLLGNYSTRTSQADRRAFDDARKKLDTHAIAVAGAIASFWNKDDQYARPGVRRIGDATGMNKDTALDRIEMLEAAGWITVERRSGQGGNRYFLAFPTAEGMSHPGPDIDAGTNVPPEPHECPTADDECPTQDRTELRELNNQLPAAAPQASVEDDAVRKFLDTIHQANGVKTSTRDRLAAERRTPSMRPKLGLLAAEIAKRGEDPRRLARLVLDECDVNTADNVVAYVYGVLRKQPARRSAA